MTIDKLVGGITPPSRNPCKGSILKRGGVKPLTTRRNIMRFPKEIIVEGKRESVGRIVHCKVQCCEATNPNLWGCGWSVGTVEFWQSYPSRSALGVKKIETTLHVLTRQEVEEAVKEWEQGSGLSLNIDGRVQ